MAVAGEGNQPKRRRERLAGSESGVGLLTQLALLRGAAPLYPAAKLVWRSPHFAESIRGTKGAVTEAAPWPWCPRHRRAAVRQGGAGTFPGPHLVRRPSRRRGST